MDRKLKLPPDIVSWIGEVVGQPLLAADRIPGGATREGWFVDTADRKMFLRFSPVPMPERSAFHTLGTEAAVMEALSGKGVAVPAVLAVHPIREAVLEERVPGATWFYRIEDPEEQVSVARDFIRNLARLHQLEPSGLAIDALGPIKTAREHALDRIEGIRFRGTAPDGSMDPLLRLTTDWLEQNVPDYRSPVVLVQGDTGPGNFLYHEGRVSAVVDWELSHWGDPMDDVAWLSLRTVQDTFTHLPDRLCEYSELTGFPIDESRVWYYRLFAEATMATLYPNDGPENHRPGEAPDGDVTRDIGNGIIYRQLHRRLWLEALVKAMGITLEQPTLPDPDVPTEWHHYYGDILGSLRTVVPRISDPLAKQWTKGVARVVKYLEDLDSSGRQLASLELDEIALLVGYRPADVTRGRIALADAASAGTVSDGDYVRYFWNKVVRDDYLMRNASGALRHRTWPPLV